MATMMMIFTMQMMDTEAVGVVAVAMVVMVAVVAMVAMVVVERTLLMTITKGCDKKLQTVGKTSEPRKKLHGDNSDNSTAQCR